MNSRLRALVLAVLATVCVIVLAGCGADPKAALSAVKTYRAVPGNPLTAPHASVADVAGGTWSYDKPAAGKITLLYFGYTSCPDVCPMTLADLANALRKVPAEVRDKVDVRFVSTDPRRDTTRQIKGWLASIDPAFHGGRAPIASVISAARAYGIFIEAPKQTKGDYEVTHGAQLLVLDPHGGAVGYFSELAGASAYQAALPALVKSYA